MLAGDLAKSMIKMHQYKQLMKYSMMLPVMVMVPLFLAIQGVMVYCIGKVRNLVPLVGPQPNLVPARAELELYYFHDSPCCQKVRLVLEEVGLASECRMVHLDIGRYGKYDHLKDAHLARNPTGTVPVLVHGGRPVLDATTILRYVEERLDGHASLVPPSEAGRADMDALVDECDVDLRPKALSHVAHSWGNAIGLFSLQSVSYSHAHYGFRKNLYALLKHPNPMIPLNRLLFNAWHLRLEPSVTEEVVDRVEAALAAYEARLADGRAFLCGVAYTLADAAALPLLHRMDSLGVLDQFVGDRREPGGGAEPPKAKVRAYYDRLMDRPSSKRVFQQWEPKTKIQKAVHAALKKRRRFVAAVGVVDAFVPDE